jgi:hypothetical protein
MRFAGGTSQTVPGRACGKPRAREDQRALIHGSARHTPGYADRMPPTLEIPAPSDPVGPVVPETPTVPADPVPGPVAPDTPGGPDAPEPNDPIPPGPDGPDVDSEAT